MSIRPFHRCRPEMAKTPVPVPPFFWAKDPIEGERPEFCESFLEAHRHADGRRQSIGVFAAWTGPFPLLEEENCSRKEDTALQPPISACSCGRNLAIFNGFAQYVESSAPLRL